MSVCLPLCVHALFANISSSNCGTMYNEIIVCSLRTISRTETSITKLGHVAHMNKTYNDLHFH